MTIFLTDENMTPEQRKASDALMERLKAAHGERTFNLAGLLVNFSNLNEVLAHPCCTTHQKHAHVEMGKTIGAAMNLLCAAYEIDSKTVTGIADELKKFERTVEQEIQQDTMQPHDHEGEAKNIIARVSGKTPAPEHSQAVAAVPLTAGSAHEVVRKKVLESGYTEKERELAFLVARHRLAVRGASRPAANPVMMALYFSAMGNAMFEVSAQLAHEWKLNDERLSACAQLIYDESLAAAAAELQAVSFRTQSSGGAQA